ncbi:MAG: Calx-beta domain-containing protein [Candidatus Zixiibacteriota bacterium]
MSKYILFSVVIAILAAVGCSDSGDKPTDPNDARPSISIQDHTVVEGGTLLFGVSINQATDHLVVFSYATSNGSALAGSDFTATSGSDTILIGQTSSTILVPTIDDSDVEPTETFLMALTMVTGANVVRSVATGTINDNDVAQISFAAQVRPLLQTSCAKLGFCHGSSATPGGDMYLGGTVTYALVISATGTNTGGNVVVAGNSANSTLYTKTTDTPPFPSRMPYDGPPYLTLVQQNLIRDWIDQGALDN